MTKLGEVKKNKMQTGVEQDNIRLSDIQKKNKDRIDRLESMMSSLRNDMLVLNKNLDTLLNLLTNLNIIREEDRKNLFIQ